MKAFVVETFCTVHVHSCASMLNRDNMIIELKFCIIWRVQLPFLPLIITLKHVLPNYPTRELPPIILPTILHHAYLPLLPTKQKVAHLKMAFLATVGSLSWENLLRVSMIASWGWDVDSRARARGTARRITGSP